MPFPSGAADTAHAESWIAPRADVLYEIAPSFALHGPLSLFFSACVC